MIRWGRRCETRHIVVQTGTAAKGSANPENMETVAGIELRQRRQILPVIALPCDPLRARPQRAVELRVIEPAGDICAFRILYAEHYMGDATRVHR